MKISGQEKYAQMYSLLIIPTKIIFKAHMLKNKCLFHWELSRKTIVYPIIIWLERFDFWFSL